MNVKLVHRPTHSVRNTEDWQTDPNPCWNRQSNWPAQYPERDWEAAVQPRVRGIDTWQTSQMLCHLVLGSSLALPEGQVLQPAVHAMILSTLAGSEAG